jgi:hypothetical protein
MKAVQDVQALQSVLNSYKATVKELEAKLTADEEEHEGLADVASALQTTRDKAAQIQELIKRKKTSLGVDGRLNLDKLSSSQFLQLRMSARALKLRIRERLRQRKFELALLERAYRHTSNG